MAESIRDQGYALAENVVTLHRVLPPTLSHKKAGARSFKLVSPARTADGQKWMARIEITQSKKTEVYLFDEVAAEGYPPGFRRFVFLNQTTPPQENRPGIYGVTCNRSLNPIHCPCTGSVTGYQEARDNTEPDTGDVPKPHSCKHKDVIEAARRAGFFTSVTLETESNAAHPPLLPPPDYEADRGSRDPASQPSPRVDHARGEGLPPREFRPHWTRGLGSAQVC